ncbi:hypothetical protein CEXT_4681 [Caerostris extrusa]|uniref:Uncharacterized protein n=1 Tax=Caerostris extrusa TaxID=172846 RepID=A0AAV4Y2T1_CAEEX|nr:hypothetical protein CEXT_4681 [Caerostris extrusa]
MGRFLQERRKNMVQDNRFQPERRENIGIGWQIPTRKKGNYRNRLADSNKKGGKIWVQDSRFIKKGKKIRLQQISKKKEGKYGNMLADS